MATETHPLAEALRAALGRASGNRAPVCVEGKLRSGAINQTLLIRQGGHRYFVKLNASRRLGMFEAERDALQMLSAADCLRVPAPVCIGAHGEHAFLVLEYLELRGSGDAQRLGAGLAALHGQVTARFGWHRDNTIGLTPQHNSPATEWATFWRDQRLGFQLSLAVQNGYAAAVGSSGQRLLEGVPDLLRGHAPEPALLHGDLWGGNRGFLPDGTPVVFDPASYYGDRETDLAMCALFGGFGREFWDSYQACLPPTAGHEVRRDLYQLYHVLNHLNLFGGAYLAQAQGMIERLLAELG